MWALVKIMPGSYEKPALTILVTMLYPLLQLYNKRQDKLSHKLVCKGNGLSKAMTCFF